MKKSLSAPLIRPLVLASVIISILAISPVYGITINGSNRSVTTSVFFIQWSQGSTSQDPEAITTLQWMGMSLTNFFPPAPLVYPADCSAGNVEYWGNAWSPPDPEVGGSVLVGAGTTGSWAPGPNDHVNIASSSTLCPSDSAGVGVATTYKFFGDTLNKFKVTRAFSFGSSPFVPANEGSFCCMLRPYVPRLSPVSSFSQVWFPTTANVLSVESAFNCPFGGPPEGIASCVKTSWVQTGPTSWFALHDPSGMRGVVVIHDSTTDSLGNPIPVALWVDFDGGSFSTASSVLALGPTTGFAGTLNEEETFCFYNSATAPSFVSGLVAGASPPALPSGC